MNEGPAHQFRGASIGIARPSDSINRLSPAIFKPSSMAACANGSVRSATATAVERRSCSFNFTSINDATATSPSARGRERNAQTPRAIRMMAPRMTNHNPRSPAGDHQPATNFEPTETATRTMPAHNVTRPIDPRNCPRRMRLRTRATIVRMGLMFAIVRLGPRLCLC